MTLAGELGKYIGNEIIKVGKKDLANNTATSALSSVIPKASTKVGAGITNKAGDSLLNQATALGITKNDANKWILNTGILDTDEGVSKIKDFMNPILGGDKTPSYQRFLEQIGEGEYQMGHRPNLYVGDSETKFPLSNMEADPDYLPKIYGDNEASTVRNLLMLGNTGPDAQRSAKIIAQYQNQPDKMVKIFRQAPKDMNYGDWVGLSEEYANNHIGNNPNNKLWEREVPASEVMFAGDDINEWGYYPKEVQLDDVIANELNKAIEISGTNMGVAKRADSYLGGRMLDKNGKPMTFYHGSPSMDITDFDINMAGKNTRSGERAIWFTDDYPTAEEFSYERIPGDTLFADKRGAKGKVYERNLGLENPLNLSNLSDKQIEELYKYADSRMAFDGKENFIRRMKEFRDAGNDQLMKSQLDMKKLSNSEYDGIVAKMYPGENEVREIGVFDPRKIKNVDNKRPVRHIPVSAIEGVTTDIPVNKSVMDKVAKYLKSPTDASGEGTDIAVHRGDVSQQIATDPQLERLRQSPARDMLGQEQLDAYKRALNGEVLDDDFLKNDSFAQILDQESNSRPYLITEDQEKGRAPIPEQQLQEFRDISRKFIDSNLKGVEKGRKAVIVLGRPSSGKSSGAVNAYSSKKGKGFFELDNDEIKKLLPGYDDGMGANAVHPASSYISNNMVLPELANEGYNIVLPIVGKKEAAVEKYLNALYDRGYEICMVNTNLPLDKCRTRNRTRAYETGRNVADGYLVSVGENPDMVYNKYKENIINGTERRINGFAEISTDVPFGSKARVIENSGSELLARLGLGPNKK